MSAKPCPFPMRDDSRGEMVPCGRPKRKGKQRCEWHWLLKQSSDIQAAAARQRLARSEGREYIARFTKSEIPDGHRWCAGCQSLIPLFYASGSRCKACVSMKAHAARVEKVYGIDAAEYDRLFKLQGGRCAICRNQSRTIRFAVDHDHKTGEVRGLLCKRCNHELLGGGHDDVAMLWRAIGYLLFPPAQQGRLAPPSHGHVVVALRAHLEAAERSEADKRPAPEPPPF